MVWTVVWMVGVCVFIGATAYRIDGLTMAVAAVGFVMILIGIAADLVDGRSG